MVKIIRFWLCVSLLVTPTVAWNRAGHMVSGAIAYQTLKAGHPDTLKKVLTLLRQHPDYLAKWESAISDLPDKENHDLYIFMLAAKYGKQQSSATNLPQSKKAAS